MKKFRVSEIIILVCIVSLFMAFPAFAAKAIKSVSISAEYSDLDTDDTDIDEAISVSVSGTGYVLDNFEIENIDNVWNNGEIPILTIYLSADDDYYFSVTKASQIKLKKCKYISAKRQDSSRSLIVKVQLTGVEKKVGEIDGVKLEQNGNVTWSEAQHADTYEVRVLRDDVRVASVTVKALNCNIAEYYTKAGSYSVKVRGVHKDDSDVKGEWAEADAVFLSEEQARANREAAEEAESAGEWIQDSKGWRFKTPDGNFVTNSWKRIHKVWYYFRGDSYAATGWIQVDGFWYYFDPTTGAMWYNRKTPDGHELAIDGRMVQ